MNGPNADTIASNPLHWAFQFLSDLYYLSMSFPTTENKQKCFLTPGKIISLMLPNPLPVSTWFWEQGALNWTCDWCNIHVPMRKDDYFIIALESIMYLCNNPALFPVKCNFVLCQLNYHAWGIFSEKYMLTLEINEPRWRFQMTGKYVNILK